MTASGGLPFPRLASRGRAPRLPGKQRRRPSACSQRTKCSLWEKLAPALQGQVTPLRGDSVFEGPLHATAKPAASGWWATRRDEAVRCPRVPLPFLSCRPRPVWHSRRAGLVPGVRSSSASRGPCRPLATSDRGLSVSCLSIVPRTSSQGRPRVLEGAGPRHGGVPQLPTRNAPDLSKISR